MLTITDAERLRTVAISIDLAQSVGVFKDMAIRNQREKDLKEAIDKREHDWKYSLDAKKYFVEDPGGNQTVNMLVSRHCKAVYSKVFRRLTIC